MDQIKIGKFIAQMRKEQGLTQSQLAEKLNISNRTVSKWETGSGMPDVSLLSPLCEALNITADELFAGERAVPKENTVTQGSIEKKPVSAKKIFLILLAIILIITLSALTTCHFAKEKGVLSTADPSATIQTSPLVTDTFSPTPTILGETDTSTASPTVTLPSPTATDKIVYVPGTDKIVYVTPNITPTSTINTTPTASNTQTPFSSITPSPTAAPSPTATVFSTLRLLPPKSPTAPTADINLQALKANKAYGRTIT